MNIGIFKPALFFLTVILLFPSCEEPEDITFPDPIFEMRIREVLDIPTGDITTEDMLAITELRSHLRRISDITGNRR